MRETEVSKWFARNARRLMPSLDISTIRIDAKTDGKVADIVLKTKDNEQILIEVKSSGEPSYIFKAISQLKYSESNEANYSMIAVPKISEKGKAICRNMGVGYMDMQGNVFVRFKDKLIDKEAGYKIPKQFKKERKRVKKIFARDSMRFFVVLLNNLDKWLSQEELRSKADVSKAYINRILKTLESGVRANSSVIMAESPKVKMQTSNAPGFVTVVQARWRRTSGKKLLEYRTANAGKLLDVISQQYNFSKNNVVSLYSFKKDPYKLMREIAVKSKKLKIRYALTMHAGASQAAPFVRFEDVYFYARKEEISKWAKALDLKQTELGGNVFIVTPQDEWILNQTQTANNLIIVNNVQLYMDLVNYPKRGREQAEFLRKQKIGF